MAPVLEDREGFWGKPTSTLDWCEENYAVTPYIAEFWNTVSNFLFFILPTVSAIYFYKDNVEKRYFFCCLGFLAVGIGSWGFHMTLRYDMQLLDELPMLWGSCVFLYSLYECKSPRHQHSALLIGLLFFICIITTVPYVIDKNPLLFHIAYGMLTGIMVLRGFYLTCSSCKQVSKYLFYYAVSTYGLGFILWNIDNNFCPQVRYVRNLLPTPLSFLTQLHFWWHLFSGCATQVLIVWGCDYRQKMLNQKSTIYFFLGVMPFIRVEKREEMTNGKNHHD